MSEKINLNKYLACFGLFDSDDKICRRYCILCIRCGIQKEYEKLEMEDEIQEEMESVQYMTSH
jgi:hypothetical protein